ncbi:MAG TPA: glycosyltransferase family 39 protein [Tepidisphaeraceae bacterium]|jgi:hypothetical protein
MVDDSPAAEPPPQRPDLSRRWKVRVLEAAVLLALVLLTIAARWHHRASPSEVLPGTLGAPDTPHASDPPSIDELWHLALSTGQGEQAVSIPTGRVAFDVPAMTAIDAARPWWTVWTTLNEVVHPPLYAQTLRLWRDVFGGSDPVSVAFSVAWSCLAAVLLYLATRTLFGRPAAAWVGVIAAVAPTQIYFGLDVRAYAMLTAWCAALLYVTVCIDRRGVTALNAAAFAVVLLGTMLTHYLAAMTCLAAGVAALGAARRGQRWQVVAAGVGAAAVYCVVWLPTLRRQFRDVTDVSVSFFGNAEGSIWEVLPRTLTLPLRLLSEGWQNNDVALLVGFVLLFGPLILACKHRRLRVPAIIAIGGSVGLFVIDLIGQTKMTMMIRYCAPCAPAILVGGIGALSLFRMRSVAWPLHIGATAAVVVCSVYRPDFPVRNDAPTLYAMAQAAGPFVRPGQTLIFCSRPDSPYVPWYGALEMSHVPRLFPRDVLLLQSPATPAAINDMRGDEAWVFPLFPGADPAAIVPGATTLQEIPYAPDSQRPSLLFRAYRISLPPRGPG